MNDLPAPLVPADVDLRGLPFMPLHTVRLLDSDFFALSTGEEFKAGLTLWCKAWQQVPAASLPNDERILAWLSGSGARWKKVREMALHGFVLCADARLYHPVIAAEAMQAWCIRISGRKNAAKRWQAKTDAPAYATAHAPAYPPADATAMQATATGTATGTATQTSLRSSGAAPPLDMPEIPPELDRRKPNGQAKTPRGSRLSAHWQPDAADTLFARQCGLDPERVAAEFRDYWVSVAGGKGVKLDWSATFRNRCRQLAERAGPPTPRTADTRDVLSERRRPTGPPRPEDDIPVSYDE